MCTYIIYIYVVYTHSHTHLEQGILRVQVEALFVRVDRCLPLTLAMQRGAQPRIALGPDFGFVFDSVFS